MAPRTDHPVTIRGQRFESEAAAAAHFGISRRTVQTARRAGRLDQVGLGRGWKPLMPVRIRGVLYDTAHDAAAALGCSRATIYQQISRGNPDAAGLGKARPPRNARPLRIGPLTFASRAEAARQLGVSRSYVNTALRRGSRVMLDRLTAAAMARVARDEAARGAAALAWGATGDTGGASARRGV